MTTTIRGARARALVLATAMAAVALVAGDTPASTIDFEDVGAGLAAESAFKGEDLAGGFQSGAGAFGNHYDPGFNYWEGFAYSNQTDTTTQDFSNDTSALAGGGALGSATYAVGFTNTFVLPAVEILFAETLAVQGAWFTNTTFTGLTMENGDGFSKKFGGVSGDDEDWLLLSVRGFDGALETGSVGFYLADYRFADNGLDYIVDAWTWVDLAALGAVDALRFELTGSDMGVFGLNTPAYFAMDSLLVPEPASAALVAGGLAALGAARRRRRIAPR